ncbi:MAG: hypothetical protein M1828_000888 [Chrysothrix sp. TS-e1954]|nr:MAG: hypothetical protein M1828_000888 [Chrysothrix sp. TS-e1954]
MRGAATVYEDFGNDFGPRERPRTTYKRYSRSNGGRLTSELALTPLLAGSPGLFNIPTPVLRRDRHDPAMLDRSRAGDQVAPMEPDQAEAVPESSLQRQEEVFREKSSKRQDDAAIAVKRNFSALIIATRSCEEPRTVHGQSRSLFSQCLRAVPAYIAEATAQRRLEDPDHKDNVAIETFDFLQSFEVSEGKGWASLREVTRAQGIHILVRTIEAGLIKRRFCLDLCRFCRDHGQIDAIPSLEFASLKSVAGGLSKVLLQNENRQDHKSLHKFLQTGLAPQLDLSSLEEIAERIAPIPSATILLADVVFLIKYQSQDTSDLQAVLSQRLEFIARLCQAPTDMKPSSSIEVERVTELLVDAAMLSGKAAKTDAFNIFKSWISVLKIIEPPYPSVRWFLSRLIVQSSTVFAERTHSKAHHEYATQMKRTVKDDVEVWTMMDWETPIRPAGTQPTWRWNSGLDEWITATPLPRPQTNSTKRPLPRKGIKRADQPVSEPINTSTQVASSPPTAPSQRKVFEESTTAAVRQLRRSLGQCFSEAQSEAPTENETLRPTTRYFDRQTAPEVESEPLQPQLSTKAHVAEDDTGSSEDDELSMNEPAHKISTSARYKVLEPITRTTLRGKGRKVQRIAY